MGRKQQRPEIGSKMWDVHENLYYVSGRIAPVMEYVVTEGEVTGYLEGNYVEVKLLGPVPRGDRSYPVPRFHKLSDVGKQVFYTAREAALRAKEMTEKHERTWAWTGDPPMRRTWEKYLDGSAPEQTELHAARAKGADDK